MAYIVIWREPVLFSTRDGDVAVAVVYGTSYGAIGPVQFSFAQFESCESHRV